MTNTQQLILVSALTVLVFVRSFQGKRASVALITALGVLVLSGVLSSQEAFSGFSSEAFLTIVFFMVFSKALQLTGLSDFIFEKLLSFARTARGGLSVVLALCFSRCLLGNTAMVATFQYPLKKWCRSRGFSPSQFLIPMAFACSVGGLNCLVATSTNLVVLGVALETFPELQFGFWKIASFGLPLSLATFLLFFFFQKKLLPERSPLAQVTQSPREYSVEFVVGPGCSLIGKSISEAHLRNLQGLYLGEIYRGEAEFLGPKPDFVLQQGDQLVLIGAPEAVAELKNIAGLLPAPELKFEKGLQTKKDFYEAVLSANSHLVGKTPKEASFRETYGAVILSMARNGKRVLGKIGEMKFEGGDFLLLESDRNLSHLWRNSRDFFFATRVNQEEIYAFHHLKRAGLVAVCVFALVALGVLSPFKAALVGTFFLFFLRCALISEVFNRLDWEVLVTIGAALGFGVGWEKVVQENSSWIIEMVSAVSFKSVLWAAFLFPFLLTEFLQNNTVAAITAAIFFPVVQALGFPPLPFVIAIMVGSSLSFMTVIGYQTNLMVYGVGGYHHSDFVRAGGVLKLLTLVVYACTAFIWCE